MAREFETDTRCGACGEHLRGRHWRNGAWSLYCPGCDTTKITRTSREWIEEQFCKPYAPEPFSRAPEIEV